MKADHHILEYFRFRPVGVETKRGQARGQTENKVILLLPYRVDCAEGGIEGLGVVAQVQVETKASKV